MMMVYWCVLVLPVLILEGPEAGLVFLDLGFREFDFGEKTQFMRFFRESLGDHSRSHVWKRLRLGVQLVVEDDDAGGRQLHDHLGFRVLFMTGRELAKSLG